MFEYQRNLPIRARLQEAKKRRKEALIKEISGARTLKKLRQILIRALEEGTL